jgi:ribosomal protein S18 acetylase RimI-like enzyme
MNNLTHRKARIANLPHIIALLLEDELGSTRESKSAAVHENYIKAFHKIDIDPNQYLMVVENGDEIIGTCHLTIMPSLTCIGSTRMQIEDGRVAGKYRGQKIGSWMFDQAISYAKENDVSIVQLTTNKKRPKAKHFYEKLGCEASHEGMKLYLRKTILLKTLSTWNTISF